MLASTGIFKMNLNVSFLSYHRKKRSRSDQMTKIVTFSFSKIHFYIHSVDQQTVFTTFKYLGRLRFAFEFNVSESASKVSDEVIAGVSALTL